MNEIQKGLLEMMIDLDAALRKGGVDYSIAYGTGIGAVRHKGFIPWDDDIDIFIRYDQIKDFEKCMDLLPEGKYFLQMPLSIDWSNTFYKLRLNGSTAIEESHIDDRTHKGLFIDVFVLRKAPKPGFRRSLYWMLEKMRRGIRLVSFRTYNKRMLTPLQKFMHFMLRVDMKICDLLAGRKCQYLYEDEPTGLRDIFDRQMFEDLVDVDFEGCKFRFVRRYDEFLTKEFGDYMTPPPENERVGTHIIAYSHNEDYTEWMKRYKENPKRN